MGDDERRVLTNGLLSRVAKNDNFKTVASVHVGPLVIIACPGLCDRVTPRLVVGQAIHCGCENRLCKPSFPSHHLSTPTHRYLRHQRDRHPDIHWLISTEPNQFSKNHGSFSLTLTFNNSFWPQDYRTAFEAIFKRIELARPFCPHERCIF